MYGCKKSKIFPKVQKFTYLKFSVLISLIKRDKDKVTLFVYWVKGSLDSVWFLPDVICCCFSAYPDSLMPLPRKSRNILLLTSVEAGLGTFLSMQSSFSQKKMYEMLSFWWKCNPFKNVSELNINFNHRQCLVYDVLRMEFKSLRGLSSFVFWTVNCFLNLDVHFICLISF